MDLPLKLNNKKMKKLQLLILGSVFAMAISCKKENPSKDYSNVKLKTAITLHTAGNDTIKYFYNGDDIKAVSNNGSSPNYFYTTNYTKTVSGFNIGTIYGTTPTHEGFYTLNAQGYADTARLTNIITSSFNNRDKYYYDATGYLTRSITNYNTYINNIKFNYNSDKNYSYWIYDVTRPLNPSLSTKDSVVFEYYSDKLFHVSLSNVLYKIFGKPEKNLVKKRTYYDLNKSANIHRTTEYEYVLDTDGLVTQSLTKYLNQPGNVLTRADTVVYTYYK